MCFGAFAIQLREIFFTFLESSFIELAEFCRGLRLLRRSAEVDDEFQCLDSQMVIRNYTLHDYICESQFNFSVILPLPDVSFSSDSSPEALIF